MTIAEAVSARFDQLERTRPADLGKYLKDTVQLAIKTTIVEDRPLTRVAPGWRVAELEFSDGSRVRIDETKRSRGTYRWTSCRVL